MDKMNFCEECGGELFRGRCAECGRVYQTADRVENSKYAKLFASPKEKYICSLGNSYIETFLSTGGLGNGFAVMSDKRIYFKGRTFYFDQKNHLKGQSEAKTVDLKDVTGTSVQNFFPVSLLTAAIILLVAGFLMLIASASMHSGAGAAMVALAVFPLVGGIFAMVAFFLQKSNILKIEFAGGCIAFKLKFYSEAECNNFQKQLRIAKDAAIEESENAAANAMLSAVQSIQQPVVQQPASGGADELMKYAQLLEKGLMTEAEFAEIKAKLLANK